ncbi:MAG: hypothetical protein HOL66_09395 [Rhodospirillaceae bacterium]|jgi:hypothetical protein|nr:hypothetical protein [Rhodospirillaceae bacterium]MBT6242032.1 hypothetical protein [Rhodospirillaceae bacterium]
MKVLITDHRRADISLERELLVKHSLDFAVAQCRTPEQVIGVAPDKTLTGYPEENVTLYKDWKNVGSIN